MEAAIEQCDYDKWANAKRDYDTFKGLGLTPPAAPSYPNPCNPDRKLRTTNIRTPPEALGFTGFYIGGGVVGNFNALGQTETIRGTDVVTNRFWDSSNALGGNVNMGVLFSPWPNNIRIGASGSVDFLNHDTIHSFPPGSSFLGQGINHIWTLNGQVGVVAKPGVFLFTEVGPAFVNVTQKLNFLGPVTSVDQTVTGLNVGVGAAFQPHWEFAGHPVALVFQYNHFFLPVATFNNPGSQGFTYDNRNNINKVTGGFRLEFGDSILPDVGSAGRIPHAYDNPYPSYTRPSYTR
jgi:opacity protein-like surface antigen